MKQVSPGPWPSGEGWTAAILKASPSELEGRLGIHFEKGEDDFDSFDVAAFPGGRCGQVWLFRYTHSPAAGTELNVDRAVPRAAALATAKRALHLGADAFLSINPLEAMEPAGTPSSG